MSTTPPTPLATEPAVAPIKLAAERRIVVLLAAVQFVNILDFMMVMPLGPYFAAGLGIPTSRIGIIGGSYTAAAAIAGVVGSRFLDRFDRRRALALAMLGLVVGTLGGAFAQSFATLIVARVVAGLFGGPATSISLAILADAVPPERRGRAMGAVMGSFAAASVLGVPAGLELALRGTWRTPFIAVAGLGLLVVGGVFLLMAPQRNHLVRGAGLAAQAAQRSMAAFLADPLVRLSYLSTATAFLGVFAVVPNLATFFLFNRGYPAGNLSWLYMVGGVVSFFAMRTGGKIVDRRGPMPAIWFGALLLASLCVAGFVPDRSPLPVAVIFVGFMLANSVRMVGLNTLTSKIPSPAERARFMSIQSAVQHMAAAVGAAVSSLVLVERADHGLTGMDKVALLTAALAIALPFLIIVLLRRLRLAQTPPAPIKVSAAA
jgi:predicted MFS family arabinose efflux permease